MQAQCHVTGSRSKQVGKNQNPTILFKLSTKIGRIKQGYFRIAVGANLKGFDMQRQLGQYVPSRLNQSRTDLFMGYQKYADTHDSFQLAVKTENLWVQRSEVFSKSLGQIDRTVAPARATDADGDIATIFAGKVWQPVLQQGT